MKPRIALSLVALGSLAALAATLAVLPPEAPAAEQPQVIATIPLGGSPWGVAVNPATDRVYVTAGGLSVIAGATNNVIATVLGLVPDVGVAVNPSSNRIYGALFYGNSVSVIDGAKAETDPDNAVLAAVPVGTNPVGVAINPLTSRIYVTNAGSDDISVIDGAKAEIDPPNAVVATVPTGDSPWGVAVNPQTNRIYVANLYSHTVAVIDGDTNEVPAVVPVGINPYAVGVNTLTNRIYVASYGPNEVSVIDGTANSVIATIAVGEQPMGIAVNPGTNRIYVANNVSHNVSVIDGAKAETDPSNAIVATVPVGQWPRGIDVNPTTNHIYVANGYDATVSVIEDASGPGPTPAPTPTPTASSTPCAGPSGLNKCELREGDILVKRGNSWFDYFALMGGTYYTHTGLYLGNGRVAEAVGYLDDDSEEVKEGPITETRFWTGDGVKDWAVVRPNASEAAKTSAVTYALGKANEDGVVFDIGANREDEKKFYCSKLAWKAYKQAGIDLEANRGIVSSFFDSWVTPDDLYYSSKVVQKKDTSLGRRIWRGTWWIFSPGHLTLVDSEGRRTGLNPATGQSLGEIPNASYSGPEAEVETITATDVDGEWRLLVTGFESGEYTLEAGYVDDQDPRSQVISGSTYSGETDLFIIPDPNSVAEGQEILVSCDDASGVGDACEGVLVPGWNSKCYLGLEQPIEQALADIAGDVLAVYRLNSGQTLDRWFAGRPEVSNIATIRPYEPLFILMGKDAAWSQTPSGTPPNGVSLAQGWNSACYSGSDKDAESAMQSLTGQFAVLYKLGLDQTWSRYVPGRPEVSNLASLNRNSSVLVLVTADGGTQWVFDP